MASDNDTEKRESLADIMAEIRAYGAQPPPRLMWLEIADRIEAAWTRERDEIEAQALPGNAAAMRERTCRRSIEIPIEVKPTSASHQALSAWISLAEWLIANSGKDALGQGVAKMVPLLRLRIDESRAVLGRRSGGVRT